MSAFFSSPLSSSFELTTLPFFAVLSPGCMVSLWLGTIVDERFDDDGEPGSRWCAGGGIGNEEEI